MWEVVGTMAGMIVLFFLLSLLPYAFDLPDSIAKYLGGRLRAPELEKRLGALEKRLAALERRMHGAGAQESAPLAQAFAAGEAPKTSSPWNGRFEAASAISDADCRAEALARLADEAAAMGEVDVVRQAIAKMEDSDVRDETASSCAINLAAGGKGQEAVELARSISDESVRDETLSQIATG